MGKVHCLLFKEFLLVLTKVSSREEGYLLGNNSIKFCDGFEKFDGLKFVIDNKIDIFLTSETKLDDSFPTAQFLIERFGTPYRHDRNSKGGGLLLHI